VDFSAVILDRPAHEWQTEPGPARLGGEERLEDLVANRGIHPRAVVVDGDQYVLAGVARSHLDRPFFGDGLERIQYQVLERVLEIPGIGVDLRALRVQLQNQADLGAGATLADRRYRLFQDRV